MKRIYMLDGYALIYRAYYAFLRRPVMNSKGVDTSAIFGFCKTVLELLRKVRPDYLLVALDPGGKTFRHELYPAYKANRPPTPEVIRASLPVIKDFLAACHIPVVMAPGFEADDVIGTLAHQARSQDLEVYMVTPDKDYAQLVGPRVKMYKPAYSGDEWSVVGPEEVCAKYGIQDPKQVVDILALWGDSSDNVPGVSGIGEVGARKHVAAYQSVENLLAHTEELPARLRDKLRAERDILLLSKDLVTIRTQVPVALDLEASRLRPPHWEALTALLKEYECFSLIRQLPKLHELFAHSSLAHGPLAHGPASGEPALAGASAYNNINKEAWQPLAACPVLTAPAELQALADRARAAGFLSFEPQMDGEPDRNAQLRGLACYVDAQTLGYVGAGQLAALRPLLEDPAVDKVCFRLKESFNPLRNSGIRLQGKGWDVVLMHYLLSPEVSHKAEALASTYLSVELPPLDSGAPALLFDFGTEAGGQAASGGQRLALLERARAALALRRLFRNKLEETGMLDLYLEMEMPLVPVLCDMEYEGVAVDVASIRRFGAELEQETRALEQEIRELTGEPGLNVSSPKQVGTALFEKLAIDGGKKKASGKKPYSTDEETLLSLAQAHPVVPLILQFRSVKKLLSSYAETLPQLVNPRTGRIHTTFTQTVTATGRLSSLRPNLQNIPVREERGRTLRRAFIPSAPDRVLLSADYSQIELRLMAHMSGDPDLIAHFRAGADVHTQTAAKIFHCTPEEVSRAQRAKAKTANFGILYGISAFGLSQRMGIPRTEAKELIDTYYETYPGVKRFLDETIAFAQAHGYVETLFHRKRFIPQIDAPNAVVRALARRNAINAPIQGTAADLIKLAMVALAREIEARGLHSRMILQVHDELLFDVPREELPLMQALVAEKMSGVSALKVPLEVSVGVGDSWLEAH